MKAAEGPFLARFGFLFPPETWPQARLRPWLDALELRRMEEGAILIKPGDFCQALPFVLSGSIRVFASGERGREIGLYRVQAGEPCLLSTACLGGGKPFPATAVAEGPLTVAFLPAPAARELLDESVEFRDYMLGRMAERLSGMMELVAEVAFSRLDARLERWLALEADGEGRVRSTHQEIASALGSSREVVSRILKDWELSGRLEISRGGLLLKPGFPGAAKAAG